MGGGRGSEDEKILDLDAPPTDGPHVISSILIWFCLLWLRAALHLHRLLPKQSQQNMSKACVRHILHHCDTGLHRSRDCSKGVAPILRNKDQLARQNMPQNNLCTAPAALACHLDVSIHPGFLMRPYCISYLECHILAVTSCPGTRCRGQNATPMEQDLVFKKSCTSPVGGIVECVGASSVAVISWRA